mmetsp:Transcript_117277/g.339045  ORF Transcript_117277/g.339045 Transcript_117277/m.339045 type:complete len:200 (-) Transcript_117277:514-1113(-)
MQRRGPARRLHRRLARELSPHGHGRSPACRYLAGVLPSGAGRLLQCLRALQVPREVRVELQGLRPRRSVHHRPRGVQRVVHRSRVADAAVVAGRIREGACRRACQVRVFERIALAGEAPMANPRRVGQAPGGVGLLLLPTKPLVCGQEGHNVVKDIGEPVVRAFPQRCRGLDRQHAAAIGHRADRVAAGGEPHVARLRQ